MCVDSREVDLPAPLTTADAIIVYSKGNVDTSLAWRYDRSCHHGCLGFKVYYRYEEK